MSTYINGYKIPKMSMGTTLDFFHRVREKVRLQANILTAKALSEDACSIMDRTNVGLRTSQAVNDDCPFAYAVSQYTEAQKEIKKGHRKPDYDMDCHFVVIPTDRETLVILYTDQPAFRKIWEETSPVQDYGYQDSTDDLPGGVSRKAYDARGKRWDSILDPHGGVPGRAGFVYYAMYSDGVDLWDLPLGLVEAHAPSMESRINDLAFDSLFQDRCKLEGLDSYSPDLTNLFFTLKSQVRADPKILDLKRQEIAPKILPPTIENLKTKFPCAPSPKS